MKGALRLILYVLVGGYVTVMLAMFTFQRNLQYFPRDSGLTPANPRAEGRGGDHDQDG